MDCPNCGLISPPETQRCDCGFEFCADGDDHAIAVETTTDPIRVRMECPNCGLINPQESRHCDCGFEFHADVEDEMAAVENTDPVTQFFDKYYLSPDPSRVPGILKSFLDSPLGADRKNVTWYLFARIGQDHPFLVRAYEQLFREMPNGRSAALLILWQCGDDETRRLLEACRSDTQFADIADWIDQALQKWQPGSIRPLERAPENCADLDFLWCEFRATGNLETVTRIIDVLEREDSVRKKLGEWLKESPQSLATKFCGELFRQTSILCDSGTREILSPQDLDCHSMMEELNISKQQWDKTTALFPFSLSDVTQQMLVKASAKWSLASHADKFPQILELCRSESEKRIGRCRLTLLEILARLALAKEDYQTAFGMPMTAVTLYPHIRERQTLTAEAEWNKLLAASVETADERSDAEVSAASAADLCLKATRQIRAVRAKQIRQTAGHTEIGPGDVTWECEFERSGKFRVFQRMWLGGEVVGDEWITVGGIHFRGPAYIAGPNPSEAVNDGLIPDAHFGFLKRCKPVNFGAYRFQNRTFWRFEYKNVSRPSPTLLGRLLAVARVSWFRWNAEVWVDAENSRLVKAVLALNAPSNPGIPNEEISVYCYFDEPVWIVAPPFSVIRPRT